MTNVIKYSKSLINQVYELYPNDTYAQIDAYNNLYQLGVILKEGTADTDTFHYTEILKAKSLRDLKRKAKIAEKKRKLYNKWVREINKSLKLNVQPL